MDLGLKGKVIAVTGGGSGIGEAISRACLEEEASVVVIGRLSDHVQSFLAEMETEGRACDFFEGELAESEVPRGLELHDPAERQCLKLACE